MRTLMCSWRLHVPRVGAVVVAAQPHLAVGREDRDAGTAPGARDPDRVPHRPPLAGKVGDGHAARPALVHAPDAVAAARNAEQRRRGAHAQPPDTVSWFFTDFTPFTFFATCSARFFWSAVSTLPFSVTT